MQKMKNILDSKGICWSPLKESEKHFQWLLLILMSVIYCQVALGLTGDLIADKGLIRSTLQVELENQGLLLHTPFRKNMEDPRPKEFLSQIMNVRRKIETVIGQLAECFKIQSIRAKDTWHLTMKIGRKIFVHSVCFLINQSTNSQKPLKTDKLLA